jgi:hypothetical protein
MAARRGSYGKGHDARLTIRICVSGRSLFGVDGEPQRLARNLDVGSQVQAAAYSLKYRANQIVGERRTRETPRQRQQTEHQAFRSGRLGAEQPLNYGGAELAAKAPFIDYRL